MDIKTTRIGHLPETMVEDEDRMTLDMEEDEDRTHPLGLAIKEVSSSQAGRILMTGGTIGMSQAGLNLSLRRNLTGCFN